MTTTSGPITSQQLLEQWQGHRRLTRKMIEAFPDDKLFTYSIGGMRPFSALVLEMLAMAGPGATGAATGKWGEYDDRAKNAPKTKKELLDLWDKATTIIDTEFPKITPQRFQEVDKAFGMYEGPIFWSIFYFIDNEIHHRGQGYVYLRSLGVEPPPFWER
ncbi:MAG: DinB family protein [Cyclobacteriaceae bacterium]